MKRYLFVCRANHLRSPLAESWLSKFCMDNNIKAEISSAGLDTGINHGRIIDNKRSIQLTKDLADKFDYLIAMEHWMREEIIKKYSQNKDKIICLNIPDLFYPGQKELPDEMPIDIVIQAVQQTDKYSQWYGTKTFYRLLQYKIKETGLEKIILDNSQP